jgi:hypothetical protein
MASKTDLVGLGVPPQLANRTGMEPESVTAAGTATGTATVMHPTVQFVALTTASSQDGVRFNDNWPLGTLVVVCNPAATTANIYPPTGGKWNGGTTDATITLAQNKVRLFIRFSTTLCYSILTA